MNEKGEKKKKKDLNNPEILLEFCRIQGKALKKANEPFDRLIRESLKLAPITIVGGA